MEYVIFHSSYIHSLSAEAQDIKIMVIIFQLGFLSPFLQGSFTSTGLVVSSKLPRFSDMYTLTIASADPKSISANEPVHFTKSKDGVLVEGLFWKDVEALIVQYTKEPKKSK